MQKFNVVIIGSGAAGYAAADRLLLNGVKNIALVTYDRTAGTSRNAGSDKQTYYKLSGTDEDSPAKMAQALMSGGGMHGDIAFIEAANSMRCFIHLVEYGVPFPTDKYGRFIGYKTDHDNARRGTSAGPLTSKYMTECIEKRVLENKEFTLLDEAAVIRIVTEKGKTAGVIALQKSGNSYKLLPIQAKYVIAATGGAAAVYKNTVYPDSQSGAFGLLADAGCKFCNLTEWQYGIASVGVKWNLSGSYQQVIPTYYSVDECGNKYEFLNDALGGASDACNNIFLKGYQWPFDSKKTDGSSRIDIAVSREKAKGKKVYIDYRKNPNRFDFDKLSMEAKEYLLSAKADGSTPFERLKKLNPQAIDFFKSKGVDLSKEPLEISVCAQHINGGVDIDTNWQTGVKNLFAVGETAGTFGIYRPGGSALNSTQVGALRVSGYIAQNNCDFVDESAVAVALQEEKAYIGNCLKSENKKADFSTDMSLYAAESRDIDKIFKLKDNIDTQVRLKYYELKQNDFQSVLELYRYKDTLKTQLMLCRTFCDVLPEIGSRGGAICTQNSKKIAENEHYRHFAIVTDNNKNEFIPLREVSDLSDSFEVEWNRYNAERGIRLG